MLHSPVDASQDTLNTTQDSPAWGSSFDSGDLPLGVDPVSLSGEPPATGGARMRVRVPGYA